MTDGDDLKRWWERSAVRALFATVAVAATQFAVKTWILGQPIDRGALAANIKNMVTLALAAFGLNSVTRSARAG